MMVQVRQEVKNCIKSLRLNRFILGSEKGLYFRRTLRTPEWKLNNFGLRGWISKDSNIETPMKI